MLPRTLFARSLLIIVVPVLLLQLVTTIVFVDNHWRKITSRLAFAVAGEVSIMADELEHSSDPHKFQDTAAYAARNLDLLVTFESGRTLTSGIKTSGTWEPFTAEALSKAMEQQVRRPYSLSLSPDDEWVNIGVQLPNGILRVFALERRLFSSSAYIFLFWTVGSSAILFAISAIFMRNQIRPIRKLALAAERMGKGQDIRPLKPEGAREVRQATRAFLDMHERITRQIDQRTTMLAGISHDLRTPLTRLSLGLSILGDTPEIEALKEDVRDMERMINGYLTFVRGEGQEKSEPTNLHNLLEKLVERTRRQGTEIELSTSGDLTANLRPVAFERCLQNLVSNAENYASKIWVSAKREDKRIFIRVDDNGPGLDPSLYEDVFKPFFRADRSRNTSTGGIGLGLPIVRDIVHSHGGNVHLESSPCGGLAAVIFLPV